MINGINLFAKDSDIHIVVDKLCKILNIETGNVNMRNSVNQGGNYYVLHSFGLKIILCRGDWEIEDVDPEDIGYELFIYIINKEITNNMSDNLYRYLSFILDNYNFKHKLLGINIQ